MPSPSEAAVLETATNRVQLELNSETDLEETQSALDANTAVTKIELIFSPSFSEKNPQDMLRFAEILSRRPNLCHVKLRSEDGINHHYALPVPVLSAILDQATRLRKIELDLIELKGDRKDFASLEESMRNHVSLQELKSTCWLSEGTRLELSLDPFVAAIGASGTLQSFSFTPAFNFGGVTSVTTGMLGTLPALQFLNIGNCSLTDENVTAMATALQENQVLRELRLSGRLDELSCQAIAAYLRRTAKLEVLSIHNTNADKAVADSSSSSEIRPTSTVDSSSEEDINDSHYIQVALALQANKSLKHFALHGTKLSKKSQQAFVEMMRSNYYLESISLVELGDDRRSAMEMYTVLNRYGRSRLLGGSGAERQTWVDTMALVADDIDCLFYLLSTKPSLCDLLNASDTDDTKRRRDEGRASVSPEKRQKTA